MTMGERVAGMRKGELLQVADPQELYDRPRNLFVAGFIGSPAMNLLEAELANGDGGAMTLQLGRTRVPLAPETVRRRPALRHYAGGPVVVGIRPEHLEDAAFAAELPTLQGHVRLREALGSELVVHLEVDARPALTDEVRELAEDAGATAPHKVSRATIVGRFSPRSRAREGEPLAVALDAEQLHFFDPHSGLGIYADDDTGGER
jgi:multiple sugar transport system ATP-binding protein